ncbi:Beta-glucanase/Beta-glucan synthetase [Nocardioides sp. J9]|uniref:family 16 glycosylhydrolase n=1 Tax=Nocardioides sp. J9 TaxID=935844 RepID=UPI0011A80E82|nr:family 16 glycosylhydrolase [Nocardioides sp. J9]TWG98538.1 Beta-glucanase/Beta-glucan synthetase [Nocardioides sp. J9]
MNIHDALRPSRHQVFRVWRRLTTALPAGRLRAFGDRSDQINAVIVINLKRQPARWRLLIREVGRFRTADGAPMSTMTRRLSAVDARDGRAVAATADVDVTYRVGDQLYVQPDARLADSFEPNEPVRMTRQEVAVARSHIEVWKTIAAGADDHVLVLEDDVWFRPGARAAIDNGWRDAVSHSAGRQGPQLLYLSYAVADPDVQHHKVTRSVFRPKRGLWFLSGYVLSRSGAAELLRAMPVVGPVDLWINYQLDNLDAFALATPALAQRNDVVSSNAYSILPYLARAGIVDAERELTHPGVPRTGPVLGWSCGGEVEGLAMALSMLGLRVRAFDGDEQPLNPQDLRQALQTFDALVDAPLDPTTLSLISADETAVVVVEQDAAVPSDLSPAHLGPQRAVVIESAASTAWPPICRLLGVDVPADPYPAGVPRAFGIFRDARPEARVRAPWGASADVGVSVGKVIQSSTAATFRADIRQGREVGGQQPKRAALDRDDTPWVLPPSSDWRPLLHTGNAPPPAGSPRIDASMNQPTPALTALAETFPGNLASFSRTNVRHHPDGLHLQLELENRGHRPYRSGAVASTDWFTHGRFEASIRPAPGPGVVTGFFLHRATPRQEIDIEFIGSHPTRMLTNVYFNPGDDGTASSYGYRGSPCWVELGFDTTAEFHTYGIDWRPGCISWLVNGTVVHQRASWDPTPIPYLPMRLHANVWAPRSHELAGRLGDRDLPVAAVIENLRVTA